MLCGVVRWRDDPRCLPRCSAVPCKRSVFSNSKDAGIVEMNYRETVSVILDSFKDLDFSGFGWTEPEALTLKESLPLCHHLETLSMSNNSLGDVGSLCECGCAVR